MFTTDVTMCFTAARQGEQGVRNAEHITKYMFFLPLNALKHIFSPFLLSSCFSFFVCVRLIASFLFRWPFKGYSPAHRRRPLLRLHQRQLHRCKWKRIECYYWLPTKPTKPHSLARMSGLYTFIASTSHPSCHLTHPATPKTLHAYSTFVLSLSMYSCLHPFWIHDSILLQSF